MRLVDAEFSAMNSHGRRLLQRHVEWRAFRRLGLDACAGRDVVELGCGSGFGAELLATLGPRSYVGLDLMPEQIALAQQRGLPGARFLVGDASRVVDLVDACADVLVIFGILHHVEDWRRAVAECRRLLRPGGLLFIEEPDALLLGGWDRLFHWDHPGVGFSLAGLKAELAAQGLGVERRIEVPGVFGWYRARAGS
jgi:SAM-dependent methyltransferase